MDLGHVWIQLIELIYWHPEELLKTAYIMSISA
jgi:hypothetical protein